MLRVLVLAAALAGCAPAYHVAHPRERVPDAPLLADFSLLCVAGATSAAEFNAGKPTVFVPALSIFVGLILLDTWAAD